jgi:D-beta-D-heptose 7-phosphate kinase/D-beta-D-heptose 1-phosphate adenosyltransferase
VVCVGDVMLDRFVYGDVSRVSPEAPIPVCRVTNETAMLGGAGNVVRNLVSVGASVTFVSVIGDDDIARDVDLLLRDLAGVTPTLIVEKDRPTTSKIRYVAGGQQLLRADREVTTPITDDVADAVFRAAENALKDAGALIVSDYGKGTVTDGLVAKLIAAATAAGKPVIVDPKSRDFTRYAGASLITPNLKELGEAAEGELSSEEGIARIISRRGRARYLMFRVRAIRFSPCWQQGLRQACRRLRQPSLPTWRRVLSSARPVRRWCMPTICSKN